MVLKLDVKTLVIGIAVGVIVTVVIGAGSADKTDFGIAIPSTLGEGFALVSNSDGGLFIVSAKTGMAVRVLLSSNIRAEPGDRRDTRGKQLYLSAPSQTPKAPAKY
jgi:hypothetical protein